MKACEPVFCDLDERRKTAAELGGRYLLMLISCIVSQQDASYARPGAGPCLEVRVSALACPGRDMSRLCRSSSITRRRPMAKSAEALVSSAPGEVESFAAPDESTAAIQVAIDTLDR